MINKTSPSLNLKSLDALRGFLAIYVLLGHCRWLLWAGNTEYVLCELKIPLSYQGFQSKH